MKTAVPELFEHLSKALEDGNEPSFEEDHVIVDHSQFQQQIQHHLPMLRSQLTLPLLSQFQDHHP